jgi:hypothetical protein
MKSLNHSTTVPKKPVIGPAPEMVATYRSFQVYKFQFASVFNCRIDILKGLPILDILSQLIWQQEILNGHMLLRCQSDHS